jgi:hypothetical protein
MVVPMSPFHIHKYETMLEMDDFHLTCRCGDECSSIAAALGMTERSKEMVANRIAWLALAMTAIGLVWVVA